MHKIIISGCNGHMGRVVRSLCCAVAVACMSNLC